MKDSGSTFTESTLMQRIVDLGWQTREMLQRTMKAYEERNSEAARTIWDEDKGMDRHYYALRQDLLKMLEGSQAIIALAHDPSILQRVTYLTWIG
jgi:phosphate uptake regulator